MASTPTRIAIACQGGGSHTAFTAGVLKEVLRSRPERYRLHGLSGTSGGALCAATAWYGLLVDGPSGAADRLEALWADIAASSIFERSVNHAVVFSQRLESMGVPSPDVSPYDVPTSVLARQQLRATVERHVDFERIPDLVDESTPRLLVSAVDVLEGSFDVFEGRELRPEHLLASAAVPTLFRAVEVEGGRYWDGLFSQNPPIQNFLAGQAGVEEKPDEIWIVQIDPTRRSTVPTQLEEIIDRRSELSGNLSLHQEVEFIEAVNEWVADGSLPADEYKEVDVAWIRLDRELSRASKLDRDPSFIEELLAEGEREARAFLAERGVEPVPAG